MHDERLLFAVCVHDAVPAGARDACDTRAVADAVAEDVGEWLQIESAQSPPED